jgi:hypothetical protein
VEHYSATILNKVAAPVLGALRDAPEQVVWNQLPLSVKKVSFRSVAGFASHRRHK